MINKPFRNVLLVAAASLGLGACTDGYGYSGIGLGWGSGYGGYYDDYYGYDYPYGYGPRLGYGWYDGFYYPGTGYYVIDRSGRRHRWSDGQRRYWQSHRNRGGNWSGERRAWRGRMGGATAPAASTGTWSGSQSGTTTFQGGATGGTVPGGAWRGRQ